MMENIKSFLDGYINQDFIKDFHFLRPDMLYLLIIPIIFLFFKKKDSDNSKIFSAWAKICDDYLLPHLLIKSFKENISFNSHAFFIGFTILVIAISGPTYKKLPTVTMNQSSNAIIVADMSKCQLAADFAPNRATRLQMKIYDLLKELKGTNIGFILFDKMPYVVTPLSFDIKIIENNLPSMTPEIMPLDGSRPYSAVKKAFSMLEDTHAKNGSIILATCSDRIKELGPIAKEINDKGYHLYILGTGTFDGAPIPDEDSFIKDSYGNTIISKIDTNEYAKIASIGGGTFALMAKNNSDINKISKTMKNNFEKEIKEEKDIMLDTWQDLGGIVALFAIPFFLPMFKRGFLYIFLMIFLLPTSSNAMSWQDLWLNPNQQAKKAFLEGDYTTAKGKFSDDFYAGIAAYKAKDYQRAFDLFNKVYEKTGDINALYNKGNAEAYLKKYEDAIKSYEEVIKKDANYDNAIFNLEYVKKLLEEEKKKEQEQKNNQSGGENNKENNEDNKSGSGSADKNNDKDSDKNKSNSPDNQNTENKEQKGDGDKDEEKKGEEKQDTNENKGSDKDASDKKDEDNQDKKDKDNGGKENAENKDNDGGKDGKDDKQSPLKDEEKKEDNATPDKENPEKTDKDEANKDASDKDKKDAENKENQNENSDEKDGNDKNDKKSENENKDKKENPNQDGNNPSKNLKDGDEKQPDKNNNGGDKDAANTIKPIGKDGGKEDKKELTPDENGNIIIPIAIEKDDNNLDNALGRIYEEPGNLLKNRLKRMYEGK